MSLFVDYMSAVYAALDAVPSMAGKVLQVLKGDVYPKLWLEDSGGVDWSTKTENGIEAEVALHIGSRYAGEKETRDFFNDAHTALHNVTLNITPTQTVLCQYTRHEIILDSDAVTRHGIIRFRLLISEV